MSLEVVMKDGVPYVRLQSFTYDFPGHASVTWLIERVSAFSRGAIEEANAGNIIGVETLPAEQMEYIKKNAWTQERVDSEEIDPSIPGIAAPIILPTDVSGFEKDQLIYVLIDGTHRCIKALQQGKPFQARLLTIEAATRCLLTCPPELNPQWFKK